MRQSGILRGAERRRRYSKSLLGSTRSCSLWVCMYSMHTKFMYSALNPHPTPLQQPNITRNSFLCPTITQWSTLLIQNTLNLSLCLEVICYICDIHYPWDFMVFQKRQLKVQIVNKNKKWNFIKLQIFNQCPSLVTSNNLFASRPGMVVGNRTTKAICRSWRKEGTYLR